MAEILGGIASLLVIPLLIAFFVVAFKGARNYTYLTEKYKGCFGWFSAQMVIMSLLMGIAAFVSGIYTLISGEEVAFGILTAVIGVLGVVIGILLLKRIKKKVSEKGIEGGIIMPMLMLSLGRGLKMVIKVSEVAAPVVIAAGEADKQRREEEKAKAEAEEQAKRNTSFYDAATGETYHPNSDGSMFKTADGDYVPRHQLEKDPRFKERQY